MMTTLKRFGIYLVFIAIVIATGFAVFGCDSSTKVSTEGAIAVSENEITLLAGENKTVSYSTNPTTLSVDYEIVGESIFQCEIGDGTVVITAFESDEQVESKTASLVLKSADDEACSATISVIVIYSNSDDELDTDNAKDDNEGVSEDNDNIVENIEGDSEYDYENDYDDENYGEGDEKIDGSAEDNDLENGGDSNGEQDGEDVDDSSDDETEQTNAYDIVNIISQNTNLCEIIDNEIHVYNQNMIILKFDPDGSYSLNSINLIIGDESYSIQILSGCVIYFNSYTSQLEAVSYENCALVVNITVDGEDYTVIYNIVF